MNQGIKWHGGPVGGAGAVEAPMGKLGCGDATTAIGAIERNVSEAEVVLQKILDLLLGYKPEDGETCSPEVQSILLRLGDLTSASNRVQTMASEILGLLSGKNDCLSTASR